MGLRGYIFKRSVYTVVLVFFVITLNFIIFDVMPGSPLETIATPQRLKDPAQILDLQEKYGLDKDVFTRFGLYVGNMLTFQFGFSYVTGQPVSQEILSRTSNTLTLLGISTLLAIVVGVFLGVYTAARRGGSFDTSQVASSLVWGALPTFWMGIVFILIFFFYLRWFPFGHVSPDVWAINPPNLATLVGLTEFIRGRLWHLFLPVLVLFLFQYGGFLLLTRATMIESLTEDYVLTARAKGLKERTILFKHALKNASLPIITSISLTMGFIFSGAIITETVFAWEGMGQWIYRSIQFLDFPSLQAIFFVIALMVILANFISDLLLGIVDPRIKYG
jgi:peptide/nickel transport system permease protein